MTEHTKRLVTAMKRGASAAELDEILLEIRLEREIRRSAESLVGATMSRRNLHVLNDLMRAAVQMID